MGMSTNLYLPAMETAGLDLLAVKGYNLDPAPPPKMMETVSFAYIAMAKNLIYLTINQLIHTIFDKHEQRTPNYDPSPLLVFSFY